VNSSLTLVAEVRPTGVVSPGHRVDRHFMEFVVDGERLGRILGPFLGCDDATEDKVPVLVTNWPTGVALEDLGRLLGAPPPPQLDGRTAMYVCAECGDLGCGAVTAVVEVEGDQVVWRDFGYQNDYGAFDQDAVFAGVGPFTFDRDEYSAVLRHFRSLVTPSPGDLGDVGGPE
jgi:hypothetical protein